MARARSTRSSNNNSANIGFEAKLWLAADRLRSNMDAAEYKHESNAAQSRMLTALRDSLLPRLLSGELQIKSEKSYAVG
ncbi:MAG TPA: hypothetical protein VGY75_13030 [Candidatus Udaeobacter sp.]|jgi:hypothetical protein|nr:hypothetical protein [Candidatus Udaeobacter sp.]